MNCFHCEEKGRTRAATVHLCDDGNPYRTQDCTDAECTEWVCENCRDNQAERAYEASLSDYYGGSGSSSVDEQWSAARALKESL